MKRQALVSFTISLHPDAYEKIAEQADKQTVSMAAIVRESINLYLAASENGTLDMKEQKDMGVYARASTNDKIPSHQDHSPEVWQPFR
jgi:hypothetical protein